MTKGGLTLVNAMHITASVFLSLRSGQASTMTSTACIRTTRCGSKSWRHTHRSTSIGTTGRARTPVWDGWAADAHLKRHGPPSEAVVVAVTNGRLEGFASSPKSLARGSGSCVSWMADLGVRRPAAEAGVGQDYRRIGALRAILRGMDCRSGGPQRRDGLYDGMVGAGNHTLTPA